AQVGQRLAETPDIRLVERGVNLVQHAEGRGINLEDRKQQRRSRQRALATRKQRKCLLTLAGRARQDLDAQIIDAGVKFAIAVAITIAVVAAVRTRQQQLSLPTAEQPDKAALELSRDGAKSGLEARLHRAVELGDQLAQ